MDPEKESNVMDNYAFTHYLTAFGGIIAIPLILSKELCLEHDTLTQSHLISTIFFVSGLCTLLQVTFGVRLPILQGGTFTFLAPSLALLSMPQWKCPAWTQNANLVNTSSPEYIEVWQSRIRELQGSVMVASCFQIFVGFSGLIGLFMRFIGPLTIAPTISLIGLSLFESSGNDAGKHWGISALTVSIIVLFSQYLRHIPVPIPAYNKTKKFHSSKIYVFQILPVLAGITVSWLICYIITVYSVLPSDPKAYGYWARTDMKGDVLGQAPWFRFPYPGAWGTGNGTTSYSENVGALGITKVGSRMVIVTSGFLMIFMGMFGKIAAIFTTIPTPVIGGMFFVMFGVITAAGISNLQYTDMNSSRNIFVFGFSMFTGLAIPSWVFKHPGAIVTGVTELDQVLRVLLTTSMFVGGFFGFVLDNTIPGSRKERGIIVWKEAHQQSGETLESEEVYSLPFGIGSRICTASWVRYIPFCPKPAGTDSDDVGNNEDAIMENTGQALPNRDTRL
ncbi:UNVERIFIED_CONTAM: hypothetical protein FKN15_028575 [Acipenser sinensis]